MAAATEDEKEPLLNGSIGLTKRSYSTSGQHSTSDQHEPPVRLRRHLGLWYTVGIVVGNVIGSGIFISPKGVAKNAGSVGATLIVWALMGLYALVQSLCYAELSCVLPMTGGDYSYVYYILGPTMGFLCMWTQVVLVSPASAALIAETAGLYLTTALDVQCHSVITSLVAIVVIVTTAAINCRSVKFGARIQSTLSLAKVLALCIIIVAGIVQLGKGRTENFRDAFNTEDRQTDAGTLAVAMVEGYFAYKGWETVFTLSEEIINPKRNLPLALVISLTLVTGVFVMTNAAYFSVMSMSEVLQSDAVALIYAEKIMKGASWLIPIFVSLSCIGTVNGFYLGDARYLYAAGRLKQLPQISCHVSVHYFTPFVAIIVSMLTYCLFSLSPQLEQLMQLASLAAQAKILMALVALAYLRWKRPDLPRPIKIPAVLVIVTILLLAALISLGVYSNPVTAGAGVFLALLGIPVFFLSKVVEKTSCWQTGISYVTKWMQLLLVVVPENLRHNPDEAVARQLLEKKPRDKDDVTDEKEPLLQ